MQEKWQEIIPRIIKGDQTAFRELVRFYQHQAFTLTFRILGDEDEAKDAVQEGFIKIWQHIGTYHPGNKFSSWMNRIMSNCAIDRYRKIRQMKEVKMENYSEIIEKIVDSGPDLKMDNKEIAQIIRLMASALPEKQRLVFILRDIQGMDSSEVQEVLGLSDTTVKSNLHHARRSIRNKIDRLFLLERRQL